MSNKNNLQNTVSQYNKGVTDYSTETDTIFSSKYSELLGKDNAVALQMKGIKTDRDTREKSNTQTVADLTKERIAQQQAIAKQQSDAYSALITNDDNLPDYLDTKTTNNDDLINSLQNSIYTRDKTIYINNDDSYDKSILIKTLLIVLLLVVVLSAIFLLHIIGLIKSNAALIAAVVVTVGFVYKIIHTYYWRETVHTMDEAADTVSASLRSLVGDKECPSCDLNYCDKHLKEMKRKNKNYCKDNTKDICCAHDTTPTVPPVYPAGIAIIDNDTNMNLL